MFEGRLLNVGHSVSDIKLPWTWRLSLLSNQWAAQEAWKIRTLVSWFLLNVSMVCCLAVTYILNLKAPFCLFLFLSLHAVEQLSLRTPTGGIYWWQLILTWRRSPQKFMLTRWSWGILAKSVFAVRLEIYTDMPLFRFFRVSRTFWWNVKNFVESNSFISCENGLVDDENQRW